MDILEELERRIVDLCRVSTTRGVFEFDENKVSLAIDGKLVEFRAAA